MTQGDEQGHRFADDARYSIHIADPASGAELIRYDFRFSSVTSGYKNTNTVLSYGLGTEAGPIALFDDVFAAEPVDGPGRPRARAALRSGVLSGE